MKELKSTEKELAHVVEMNKLIDNRRGTENAAFSGDVHTLRKKVTDYERFIKTLKGFVDEEKTEELIRK